MFSEICVCNSLKVKIFFGILLMIFAYFILLYGNVKHSNKYPVARRKSLLLKYSQHPHSGKLHIGEGNEFKENDGPSVESNSNPTAKGSSMKYEDGFHKPNGRKFRTSRKVNKTLITEITYKNLMQMPTPKYLKDYKASCMKISDSKSGNVTGGSHSKVMCMPAVYLAGQPKCGSTDLYSFLTGHPLIGYAFKEPQYWSRKRFYAGHEELHNYLKVYQNASKDIQRHCKKIKKRCIHEKILIDGSVSLLWDNTNWPLMPGNSQKRVPGIINAHHIRHVTPNAKVIVILRDPVEREFSSYLYFTRGKLSPADFHKKAKWSIQTFCNCSKIWGARSCAYNVTLQRTLPIRLYIGLYSIFINDWLKIFPRDQFYFLRLENYKKNRMKYIKEIFEFLEVGAAPDWLFKRHEKVIANKRLRKTKSVKDMLPSTRHLLKKFFKPYNEKLSKILNSSDYLYP